MKTILVPVGSSKNAKSHLQYAVDFAKDFNARLLVIQVYNVYTKAGTMIKVDTILERESLSFLENHVAQIDAKGVEIITKSFKGKLVNTIELVCKKFKVDLIVLEPRTNSIKDEVFLGKTSGKILKQTQIPALIIPEGYCYTPIKSVLLALKSAIIKKDSALKPLMMIKETYAATINLLLVKTPRYHDGDFEIDKTLESFISKTATSENATTYQGFLEHYKEYNPDLLCVVRRKRGFFKKFWEKNVVLKKDLHVSKFPILVLSGLK